AKTEAPEGEPGADAAKTEAAPAAAAKTVPAPATRAKAVKSTAAAKS
ncbi:DNA recombination/repair protein RecA, partial [Streptomyces verrucosisporus]|nr:DNA recombination/repair protein RecA [Streptomyces verrucosisporus]